jgi:hypothetical protein
MRENRTLTMRDKLLVLTVSIAGVVVLWSLFELRSHQQQSQQELESLRATIETLQTQMRKPPAPSRPAEDEGQRNSEAITSLARAAAQEEARRMMQQQPQQQPLEPGEEPSEQPPQAKRPPPVSYEQSQALVLAAYSGEAEDAEWSRDASRKLNTLLHSRLPGGSRVNTLECRSTMCQVEIAHTSPEAHGEFLMNGFRGWRGSVFVAEEKQEHGELVVTLFASREGMELPLGPR